MLRSPNVHFLRQILIFGPNKKCPEFSLKMSGILDPRIPPFRNSANTQNKTLTVSSEGPASDAQKSSMEVSTRTNSRPQWTNHDQSNTLHYSSGKNSKIRICALYNNSDHAKHYILSQMDT